MKGKEKFTMPKLEVDVKSIQDLIRSKALKAQKVFNKFESQAETVIRDLVQKGLKSQREGKKQVEQLIKDVRETVEDSELIKNLKKTTVYHTALEAKDELGRRVQDAQERLMRVLNVPTKQEVDRINQKLADLDKKLKGKKKATK